MLLNSLVLTLVPMLFQNQMNPVLRSEFIYNVDITPSCHAATIVETKSGSILAAWFGGTHESHRDVTIYLSRLESGTWTYPKSVADGKVGNSQFACYNPVLFQPERGPLLLFYKIGTGPQTWWGKMTSSSDDGHTWLTPHDLPKGLWGPIKNKPIEFEGAILCPSSSEAYGWRVHFESTRDFGKTWDRTTEVNDGKTIAAIQPSILKMGGEHLRAIGRTQQGRIFSVDSQDGGTTWGEMTLTELPNPNSGTDAVTLKDGRHVLVYNRSTTHRTPLNVAISSDAQHWKDVVILEDQPGEYSYPAVIQTNDGLVHIVYTWHRTRIRHVVLDPMKLAG